MDKKGKSEIRSGFLFVISSKVAIVALGFVQVTIIPRLLDPTNMGIYSYWLSVLLIFSTLLDFGGPDILSRYLPELRIKDRNSIRSLFKKNLLIKIVLLLPLILVGLYLFKDEKAYFIIILFASVFLSLTNLIQAGLYGYKNFAKYSLIQIARILFRLVLVIVFFYLLGSIGIIYALLVGSILTTLLFFTDIKKLVPSHYGKLSKPFKEYLSYGLYIYSGRSLLILITWSSVIFAKKFINDFDVVGFLGLAIQICLFGISGVLASVRESFLPTLIEFHTSNNLQFRKFIELNWKYSNIILMPAVFGFYFLADSIVIFFIGSKYFPSVEIIKLLLPSVIFITWGSIYQQIFAILENKNVYLFTQLAGFISFLIGALILINRNGVLGAPMAISLGTFISFIFGFFYASKMLSIRSQLIHIVKPVLASILAIIVINIMKVDNIYVLLFSIFFGLFTYVFILMLIKGITMDEIKSLRL